VSKPGSARPKIASYGREVDLIDAFHAARKLLMHRPRKPSDPYPDMDAWRLERAQWHYDFGNRSYAERELADINAFRRSREVDKPGQYPQMDLKR
jgi:hypothetical protein